MKQLSAGPDRIALEFSGEELAPLSDLIGRELGYQDPMPGGYDPEIRDLLDRTYRLVNQALTDSWQAEERLGPPFLDGERVTPEPQSSDAVDFGPSGTAMVIHQNRPDWSHDYDWCLVRLDDGQEIELPAFILRRLGEGS